MDLKSRNVVRPCHVSCWEACLPLLSSWLIPFALVLVSGPSFAHRSLGSERSIQFSSVAVSLPDCPVSSSAIIVPHMVTAVEFNHPCALL